MNTKFTINQKVYAYKLTSNISEPSSFVLYLKLVIAPTPIVKIAITDNSKITYKIGSTSYLEENVFKTKKELINSIAKLIAEGKETKGDKSNVKDNDRG
jgi:hypothetical protein